MTRANIETFIISQHSIGIGHLTRTSALAKAFSAMSRVTLFSGGRPIEGYSAPSRVDFIQLPALYRTGSGKLPSPLDGRYTLAETEHMRSQMLIDAYCRLKPRIIITEYFPFAPRRFGRSTLNELFNVINQEQKRPIVICSIRTVPQEESPDIDDDAPAINAHLKNEFSGVLHHSDPKLFPLTSLEARIQTALSGIPVWQTGFVRRPFTPRNSPRISSGLLLTVGGGSAAAANLLKRWIKAAKAGSPDLFPIVAVCGPLMQGKDRELVHAECGPNVTVYDWVSNMDDLISSSRAVVCLGGYNTPVEALSQNKPVLAFPDSGLGDQVFQINTLHSEGLLLKGEPSHSEPEITALMNELLSFRPRHAIDYNGAERSVEIVKALLNAA